jgi:hypothetical protein
LPLLSWRPAFVAATSIEDPIMSYGLHDLAGNIGVAIIVGTYLALQLERIRSTTLSYSLLNAVGATLIAVSLLFRFNLSAFVIEVFWIAISLVGVARWWLASRRAA